MLQAYEIVEKRHVRKVYTGRVFPCAKFHFAQIHMNVFHSNWSRFDFIYNLFRMLSVFCYAQNLLVA